MRGKKLRLRAAKVNEIKEERPVIKVGCAIIVRGGKVLIAQRRPGDSFAGYWEFPGGKCRQNESIEECLAREVWEELAIRISPRCLMRKVYHDYPHKRLLLCFYICDWSYGTPIRRGVYDYRWVEPNELRRFHFLPADADIIRELVHSGNRWLKARVISFS